MHIHQVKKVFFSYHHSRCGYACVCAECVSECVILNKKQIFPNIDMIVPYWKCYLRKNWSNKSSWKKPHLIKKKRLNGLFLHLAVGEFACNITKGLYEIFCHHYKSSYSYNELVVSLQTCREKNASFCSTSWFESDYLADLLKCFPSDHCFSLYCRMSSKGPAQADGSAI